MKKVLLLLLVVIAASCKNEAKKEVKKETVVEAKKETFPTELGKVFQAHGGIDAWRKAQVLSFNKGEEVHTTDLHSRKIVVNTPEYSLGFDGKEIWSLEEVEGSLKRDPAFYYNLYFYFYAMPFVLADEGIIYEKVADLVFEGTNYPGYKISYKANIGTSPDDNYIVYYNAKTYKMEWLAYTVTFRSKAPVDNYKMIRYNSWENVNGFVLPKQITWYSKDKDGKFEPTNKIVDFTMPLISQGKLADSFYEKPAK
ncbi:hypothetical protein QWY81_00465 [Polaribacter undariae]|uniref:Threonine synthase n=1 Tax=Polaribacter sejongensis TaxID=985043 RepID=A0AAJ1QTS6_9FLAO|nr:DUF6503 family protein [Polaribacter undariae]MDN3617920.1 hypothetical protein [Polaribacter undariae]UWD32048.1 hypothetical protein NQP51_18200 [Polaribacter undariae]